MGFCSDIGMCLFFNDPSIDKMDAMTDERTNNSPGKNKTLEEPVLLLHCTILIGMCLFFNDPSIDKMDAMTDE